MIKEIKTQEEFDKIMHSENADNATVCPHCGKAYQNNMKDNVMANKDRVKQLLDKIYKLNYWFCNEMLTEEQHITEFEEACKKAGESSEPVIMISGATGNVQCMKDCMKDTVAVINFLRNKENLEYLEPWQLAGAEAMFNQCSENNVIPFDLPAALMAVLGMWDELKDSF